MAPPASPPSIICSICLEDVSENCGRTVVTLQCSDKFHLDCIGSAFNAKGIMECPNCQALENGVWRQFANESLQQAQDMNQDTNDEYDEDLAMGPTVLASPIHGLIVQQPSSGYSNLASTNNFNSQLNDPSMPGNEFGSMNIDYEWNGLPVLTDTGCSELGIAQCGPFHDQGYISTMCGHISDRSYQTLLLPTTSVLEPANFFQSPNDHPNVYLNGFDYANMLNNPFSFAYEYEDDNAPISDNTEELYLLNSSPSSEMLDSIVAGVGNSASDQASTSNTGAFMDMVDSVKWM